MSLFEVILPSFFQWKGTGEMIDTKFFCRMCALLHDPKVQVSYILYEEKNDFNFLIWFQCKAIEKFKAATISLVLSVLQQNLDPKFYIFKGTM